MMCKKPIILVGMMGAGKSIIGPLLAKELGLPFFDSDHEIEKSAGCSIPEIFETQGEGAFRDLELEHIDRLLANPAVIATGGGCVETPKVRDLLSQKALCVWLKVSENDLFDRLKDDETRPRFKGCDAQERKKRIAALCDRRDPLYAQADITIDSAQNDPDKTVAEIIKTLREQGDLE